MNPSFCPNREQPIPATKIGDRGPRFRAPALSPFRGGLPVGRRRRADSHLDCISLYSGRAGRQLRQYRLLVRHVCGLSPECSLRMAIQATGFVGRWPHRHLFRRARDGDDHDSGDSTRVRLSLIAQRPRLP